MIQSRLDNTFGGKAPVAVGECGTVQAVTDLRPYSGMLDEYFHRLESAGIDFCLLGGPDGSPGMGASKDVDILVSNDCIRKAGDVLKSVFRKVGSGYYSFHRYKGRHTYILYFLGDGDFIRRSLKLDLFANFEFRGRVFLSSGEILANAVRRDGVPVPCPLHAGFMALVKGVLKGGPSWEKYLPRIRRGLHDDRGGMERLSRRIFFRSTVNFLMGNLDAGNFVEIETARKRLILETYVVSLLRNPIRFPLNLSGHFLLTASRTVRPPNYMIAVLGPDGVGKSTLIRHIKEHLADMLKMESGDPKSFHIRPGLFPTITELLKRKRGGAGKPDVLSEIWQSPSRAISFLRMICFWVDYLLGYVVKILPELRNYNVVVLDRYYFDLLIDSPRYKIRLPHGLMRAFFGLLPAPRVTIVLDAPAGVIFQRKRELNEEKIETLLSKYRNLKNEYSNVHILNAMNPPAELSVEVVSTFLKCAARRA